MKLTAVEWLYETLWKQNDYSLPSNILEQAKQIEKQQKYSIDFIMWYSGMNKDQIENAHKRWIKETFKSE